MRRAVLVGGLVLLVAALVWRLAAPPILVRYPEDLDQTLRYEGQLELLVDPATGEAPASPRVLPLTVERTLIVDRTESDRDRAVVDETVHYEAPPLLDVAQLHRHVLDRRSAGDVRDPRAWAFEPDHVVDRSGAWSVALPVDVTLARLPLWYDVIGVAAELDGGGPSTVVDDLALRPFVENTGPRPLDPWWMDQIGETLGLRASRPFDTLEGVMRSAGIDLDGALAVLAPALRPADVEALIDLTSEPVDLEYVWSVAGDLGVHGPTGSLVDRSHVVETAALRPGPSTVSALSSVLGRYPDVPEAAALADRLRRLENEPIPVAIFRYDQTDDSVAQAVDEARHQLDRKHLVERWVPLGLLLAGGLLVVVGVAWTLLRRRRRA